MLFKPINCGQMVKEPHISSKKSWSLQDFLKKKKMVMILG